MQILVVLGLLFLLAEVKSGGPVPQSKKHCTVRFYEHPNMGGEFEEFNEICNWCENLPDEWKNRTSSIQMYHEPNEDFTYFDLQVYSQPGCLGDSRLFSLENDKKCLEDLTYTNTKFMGLTVPFTKDCGDNWSDRIQSYKLSYFFSINATG